MNRLQINAPNGIGATAEVLIDGQPARALTSLTLTMDAQEVTRAELRLAMVNVAVDAEAEFALLPETVAQLITLGWTPPA